MFIENTISKHLKVGISITNFQKYFDSQGQKLELITNCNDENIGKENCKEYDYHVAVLPLPGDNIWLGKGDMQIYFTINDDGIVDTFDYEVYYPRYH